MIVIIQKLENILNIKYYRCKHANMSVRGARRVRGASDDIQNVKIEDNPKNVKNFKIEDDLNADQLGNRLD